jgi:hypothetical protein
MPIRKVSFWRHQVLALALVTTLAAVALPMHSIAQTSHALAYHVAVSPVPSAPLGTFVFFACPYVADDSLASISLTWDFGDGTSPANGRLVTHSYSSQGVFTWVLRAQVGSRLESTYGYTVVSDQSSFSTTVQETAPVVLKMTKKGNPFRIIVKGSNFQPGIIVTINNRVWPSVSRKSNGKLIIGGGRALKQAIPRWTAVEIDLINPDGSTSTNFFIWY